MEALASAKRRVRQRMRRRGESVGASQAESAGRAVAAHLANWDLFRNARRVALYAGLPGELPTTSIFEAVVQSGRMALLPRATASGELEFAPCALWEELEPGRYGVLEPPMEVAAVTLGSEDLACVPGVAFDEAGHRLGRGKGYYDRTLRGLAPNRPFVLGVAHAFQLLTNLPAGPDDEPVDAVATEAGITLARGAPR